MPPGSTVYIVDDDRVVRQSLRRRLVSVAARFELFPDGQTFLDAYRPGAIGCLIADPATPGVDNLELHRKLAGIDPGLPIIYVSAFSDIPLVVRAIKSGAHDFLEKPITRHLVVECVRTAISRSVRRRKEDEELAAIRTRLDSLTPREMQVMSRVVRGHFSRQIAEALEVTYKTIETHRSRILHKMDARGVADLVRLITRHQALQNGHPGRRHFPDPSDDNGR